MIFHLLNKFKRTYIIIVTIKFSNITNNLLIDICNLYVNKTLCFLIIKSITKMSKILNIKMII